MRYSDAELTEFRELIQKKLDQASKDIDLAKVRSRAIEKKLGDVQQLPNANAPELFEKLQTFIENDTEPIANTEERLTIKD